MAGPNGNGSEKANVTENDELWAAIGHGLALLLKWGSRAAFHFFSSTAKRMPNMACNLHAVVQRKQIDQLRGYSPTPVANSTHF